jgi:hypothetical protein
MKVFVRLFSREGGEAGRGGVRRGGGDGGAASTRVARVWRARARAASTRRAAAAFVLL